MQVGGLDVAVDPLAVRQRLGFLTNTTGLYPRLTGRELLRYFGAPARSRPRRERRRASRRSRGALELGAFFDRRCEALSTGERQRLSIARAVLHDPAVLVLDEPTAGLDVLASRFLRDFVRAERDRGKAVVFSTHYLAEAELLCDRIGLLHRGRLLARGDAGGAARGRRRRAEPGGGVPAPGRREHGARRPRRSGRNGAADRTDGAGAMKLAEVLLVAGKELRETLRDRRTLAVMVLFPLVVYPLVSLATVQVLSARIGRTEKMPARVAIAGPARGRRRAARPARGARHDGNPDFALSPPPAPATAAEVRAGRLDAAIALEKPPGARGGAAARRRASCSTRRRNARAPRASASKRRSAAGPRRAARRLRGHHRGRGARTAMGGYLLSKVLPLIIVVMVHGGRVSSRHRHHRRRARARHAGDDAVRAHRARLADDRQGGGGRDAGGAERAPQPRVDVDHGARGRQAGGAGAGAVAALG